MLLNTDYILPQELTGYVRPSLAEFEENRFRLAQWLPSVNIDDLQYRFTAGGEGLAEAATFRAFDAESGIGSRPGVRRVSGELPPISRKVRLGEYDRLRQRRLNDGVVNGLLSDARRMTLAVAARMELARGDALVTGKVTINENGVVATADFGRAGSHTVAPGTLWTTANLATATPLTNLVAWFDTYKATNGEPPGVVLVSTTISRFLQRSAEIINAVAGSTVGKTRVTLEELQALLQSEGLPRVEVIDEQVRVNGVATRVIAADKVLLLPAPGDPNDPESSDLGATVWGTTAESLEPEYGIEDGEEPGIVAGAYSTKDPVAIWTKAAGIGLPVLANPDLSFMADVA